MNEPMILTHGVAGRAPVPNAAKFFASFYALLSEAVFISLCFSAWLLTGVILRRKVLLLSAATLAVFGLAAILISRYGPDTRLMYCGHPDQLSLRTRLHILMGSRICHLCRSRGVVMHLQLFAHADISELHILLVGYSPTPLKNSVLQIGGGEEFRYVLTTNGSNWNLAVPQQGKLAGNYLLTSAGRLHFNSLRAATTNDYMLHDWSH